MKAFYHGVQSFIAEEPRRGNSPHLNLGTEWRQPPWEGRWTLFYAAQTGEVYALPWEHPQRGFPGPVIVLGRRPVYWTGCREGRDREIKGILDGWEVAQNDMTLEWVTRRLDAAEKKEKA